MPHEFNAAEELERLVGEEMGQDFRNALLAKILSEEIATELRINGGYATWEEYCAAHKSTDSV